MNKETKTLKLIPFDVHIPNLDGDGIAQTVRIEVPAYTDPASGEDILTPEAMDLIEKTQARHMGIMSAGELRELRTRLELSQDEMSDLLQIGGKSYTRWESGRARPSRSMNVFLCALRDGLIDVNYLRALRNPGQHSEWQPRDLYHHALNAWMTACSKHRKHAGPQITIDDDLKSLWKHLCQFSSSPDMVIHTGQENLIVHVKSGQTQEDDASACMLQAQRLPSSWQQREAFMKTRFDASQIDKLTPA